MNAGQLFSVFSLVVTDIIPFDEHIAFDQIPADAAKLELLTAFLCLDIHGNLIEYEIVDRY